LEGQAPRDFEPYSGQDDRVAEVLNFRAGARIERFELVRLSALGAAL